MKQIQKQLVAHVYSAVKLTKDEETSVKETVSDIAGEQIPVEMHIDKDLMGGLKIEVGDWILDTTISSQLKRLTASLAK